MQLTVSSTAVRPYRVHRDSADTASQCCPPADRLFVRKTINTHQYQFTNTSSNQTSEHTPSRRKQKLTRIAIGQQRADRQQHLGNGQRRRPVVLQNVQTDDALAVDVAVVDAGAERDLRRLERILGRKVNVQKEDAALVHRAGRPQNSRHPFVQVVRFGAGTAIGRRIQRDFGQLFLDAFRRRAEGFADFRIRFRLGFGFVTCATTAAAAVAGWGRSVHEGGRRWRCGQTAVCRRATAAATDAVGRTATAGRTTAAAVAAAACAARSCVGGHGWTMVRVVVRWGLFEPGLAVDAVLWEDVAIRTKSTFEYIRPSKSRCFISPNLWFLLRAWITTTRTHNSPTHTQTHTHAWAKWTKRTTLYIAIDKMAKYFYEFKTHFRVSIVHPYPGIVFICYYVCQQTLTNCMFLCETFALILQVNNFSKTYLKPKSSVRRARNCRSGLSIVTKRSQSQSS